MRTTRAVIFETAMLVAIETGCATPSPSPLVTSDLAAFGTSQLLIRDTDRKAKVNPPAAGAVLQKRWVEANTSLIVLPSSQTVRIPLFDGRVIKAVGTRTERAGEGFVWIGHVQDQPRSRVILSVQGNTLSGSVHTEEGENYEIRPAGNDVFALRQLDQKTFAKDDINEGPSSAPLSESPAASRPCGGTESGKNIDVLVGYTTEAKSKNGGKAGIEGLIYGAFSLANQTFIDSGMPQRLRVVHLQEEVDYKETGKSCQDLISMHNPSDKILDDLPIARNTYGADLVILVVHGALSSTTKRDVSGRRTGCGGSAEKVNAEAYDILNPNTSAWEMNAYAVVSDGAITADFTLAHEVGHLMGARHDRAADATNGSPFDDNHGFIDKVRGIRSVMAVNPPYSYYRRVGYWSYPPLFGIELPYADAADNVNALRQSASTVASFRCSSPGRTDVWMRDTWDDTGAEPDAATTNQAMWESPYIWIRTSQDATFANEHRHQKPGRGTPVFVYVKLHHGMGVQTNGDVELYYADSSTGLAFPMTWTLIDTKSVTSFPPSSTQIVEFPWTTPPSGDFSLLARWSSTSDPITAATTDITTIVRGSNNVVWRSLVPLGDPGSLLAHAIVLVRNLATFDDYGPNDPLTLRIAPPADEANGSFFNHGQTTVSLGKALLDAWHQGGSRGSGFEELPDGRLRITDPEGAQLENIRLPRDAQENLQFEFRRFAETPQQTFHVEVSQVVSGTTVGGVTYELTPP